MATLLRTVKPSYLQSHMSGLPRYMHVQTLKTQKPLAITLRPAPQRLFSSQKGPQRPNSHQEVSHEMPKISWKELGASKPIKIVLIIALSIIGTMETIFYFKLFMRKFFPNEEPPEGEFPERPASPEGTKSV
ncbi:hypothetical protein TWF696_009718 [Orbilia brochopaga]|uniref:Uncharacterized protein n=1 Tax=Orbilia brochopaga TaxID=3140254 RepID=A0AAV9UFQ4_9PEZI